MTLQANYPLLPHIFLSSWQLSLFLEARRGYAFFPMFGLVDGGGVGRSVLKPTNVNHERNTAAFQLAKGKRIITRRILT